MLELILAACLTSTLPGSLNPTAAEAQPWGPATLVAPALLPSPGSSAAVVQEKTKAKDIFPAPRTGITLHVGDDGAEMSLLDLCAAYAEVTGQRVTYGEDTESLLRNRKVQLDRSLDVEPGDLQQVFETMMISSDFVILPLFEGATPIFKVASLQTGGRSNLRASAIAVAPEESDILERHPAVIFTTTVFLPNVDVRQVSNSMRTMITDANTQQMLPAGNSNSMVLVGFGRQLAGMRAMLLRVNDAAGFNVEARRSSVEILKIEHADAEDIAKLISLVFQANEPNRPPHMGGMIALADERTNSLILRGTRDQIARAKNLVGHLDIEVKK